MSHMTSEEQAAYDKAAARIAKAEREGRTKLNLGGLYLTELPPEISRLTDLHVLILWKNRLTAVPDCLRELTQLQILNLSHNKLTAVPDWLGELTQLQPLNLSSNQLTAVPDSLRELTQLRELDLRSNRLTAVPDWLAEMPSLKSLYIWDNPITQPPPEQLGKALTELLEPVDLDALRRYFAQLRREGEAYFYEAKLLIIGEGGAGKTSLVRKLQNSAATLPLPEDSTDGIDIQTWSFPLDQDLSGFQNLRGQPEQYHVNIWDFGGQTVYHATHQFFLTKRSVYILVADTRRQQTDFYDWLKMQETFGDNSPIILLKNRNRKHGNEFVIENLPHLQSRFPNLKEIVEIDLNNVPQEAEWPDLLRSLQKHFLALDHIGVARPKTWVEVRKTLDADHRDTISRDDYLALCAEHGIGDPADALQLSDYLHHLGDILHFQDDAILTDLVILKPTWGLDAVYRVLDNKEIATANGQFTLAQLRRLWHEDRYNYHRDKLLRLMQKFQLCYPLRDAPDTYIAPQLLDIKTPNYMWGGGKDDLQLRFSYPLFMPRGLLSRAIVALHHRIEDQHLVWRTGVILHDEYARAELLELRGEKEIRIRVSGGNRRDLLMEIKRTLDELHRAFPKLQYKKLVPCCCQQCKQPGNEPHFFDIELLNRYRDKGVVEIRCDKSLQEVNVLALVDDAILQTEMRHGEINYHIHGDYTGGDRISTGNISNSKGVGIGAGVQVNVVELQQIISQLHEALQQVPADKAEDAEAVAHLAETLVATASSEKPNKVMLNMFGENLKAAAAGLAAESPGVLAIVEGMITAVSALTG